LDGVAARHGAFDTVGLVDGAVRVTCADGTEVTLRAPFDWRPGPALLTSLSAAVRLPHRAAVLLVRRGRWAVGVFDGADLLVSKVDARQVQGRTAAGGWSQQRFARRRDNQAKAAAAGAADIVLRLLLPRVGQLDTVVAGGDRRAVEAVLADPRTAPVARLRCPRFLDVPEPNLAVLREAVAAARAVHIRLIET
jgi:hypothetical protein